LALKPLVCQPILVLFANMDFSSAVTSSQSPAATMDVFLNALNEDARKVDSEMVAQVISKLSEQQAPADVIVSMPVLIRVHQSPQRMSAWLKYEILLTKVLTSAVVKPDEFESVVLPLLKEQMDVQLQAKFGSCLKGAVTSYRKLRATYREEQFVQLMEWIGWLCSPAADY
jgi:hypothetical protein